MRVKAKESQEIVKARAKLKHQMAIENKKFNSKALQKMSQLIQHWLTRHKSERVELKLKSVKVFDGNVHPAKTKSKFINHLLHNLSKSASKAAKSPSLGGRVSGQNDDA